MKLEQIKEIIKNWAIGQPLVRKAYIFGSRARDDWQENSDIDIAVEIKKMKNDENEFTTWIFEKKKLESSLQDRLPFKLQLERHDIIETPTVRKGIKESSILVYSSKGDI